MTKPHTSHSRIRVGLTGRLIVLTSLVLVGLVALITTLGHDILESQFQQEREDSHAREQREMRLALERAEDSLQQLAAVVAAAPGLSRALEQRDKILADQVLATQWPTLELDAGVAQVRIYLESGRLLSSRGDDDSLTPGLVEDWLDRVRDTERPHSDLRCAADCLIHSLVPVLVDGEMAGTVLVSRSLADLTQQVRNVSGSEVALLLRSAGQPETGDMLRQVPEWGGHLLAITRIEQTLPTLRAMAEEVAWSSLSRDPVTFKDGSRVLEVQALPLAGHGGTDTDVEGYLLSLSDISSQVAAIREHTRNLFLAGMTGWVIAEVIVLLIVWPPMRRLYRLAEVLPGLASGGFARTREVIPEPRRRFQDEIDELETTTLDLADQLETLEGTVQNRDQQLAAQIQALARERDFIGSLLDTARVFIISQDSDGRITLVNEYTTTVLEHSEEDLIGRTFDEVLPIGSAVLDGDVQQGEEERSLRTPGGEERVVVWYHAPLPGDEPGRISVGLDISERKAAEARLTWLAQRDPLTELYNRRYFHEALDQALAKGAHGAVLLMDLDQFRDVNELRGYHAGDELLRRVGHTLYEYLGYRGVIARLGGDEFALLLEGASDDQAMYVAQYVVKLLEDVDLAIGEQHHRVSASIGIARFPEHGATPADLMASADVAMYQAKEGGPQRWHLLHAVEDVRDELEQRVYWVDQLHKALKTNTFELMVQPIVRLSDRSVRHYEVLLRMHGGEGELLMPGRFIPFAERSGQIVQLDRWVLRAALQLLGRIQDEDISLAVNLSGQSLHDDYLTDYLAEELRASGANPRQLILEVTETAAVSDFSTARGVLTGIRALGCRAALDDFGVGFSSFHYLGQLPVDYIKIDGSFTRRLVDDHESRVIVRAIADLAVGLGKEAIAEFVDQEAIIPILQDYRVALGQGYHLGQPVPASEVFGDL
ncbi:EAL domain-containing protein [Thioalkalivibrio sp. ALE28]|uniref:bifunctional diguanylate cyclase/phosphodiesterase n=1 Tax=Thioalkalivibrio sp. ALE28 TaxID=1158179 RepID=UPI00037C1EA8|nr:EAL domain-containing protein [Thioalkalivibrio sp. ALE28]